MQLNPVLNLRPVLHSLRGFSRQVDATAGLAHPFGTKPALSGPLLVVLPRCVGL